MSVFLITEAVWERARELAAFAAKHENWYWPGPGVKVPGDDPRYVLMAGSTRAVLSWTVDQGRNVVLRHLSVSVPAKGRYPFPTVVWTLATMLGFEGSVEADGFTREPGEGWVFDIDEDEGTAVVQERVVERLSDTCRTCGGTGIDYDSDGRDAIWEVVCPSCDGGGGSR